jgi:hypothetical protein
VKRLAILALAIAACASSGVRETAAVDVDRLPPDVRADYDLFAKRCSKCHPLSRPLTSGIVDDAVWERYVTRMRRQPASGISVDDATRILRFLHHQSLLELERRRARR